MFSSSVSNCCRRLEARECHQSVPGVRGKNSSRRQVPRQWRTSTASFQASYVQCPSDRRYIELVSEWPNCTLSVPPPGTTSTGTLVKYDFQNVYTLTRSVRIPLLAQGWLTATSPRPSNFLTQRSRRPMRSQLRSRASPAFKSTFTTSATCLSAIHFHRKYKQLFFFILGGVNFLMQLQFLAPVELFFKQLNGYSF